MSRIAAITGGTGFIGRSVIKEFVERGWSVRALVRRAGQSVTGPATIVSGDVFEPARLDELVSGADVIVHAAGLTNAPDRAAFDRVNVTGTRNVAEAAMRVAPQARFVHLSSITAREPHLSDYSASKRASEDALILDSDELRWLTLRPAVIYGPGDAATRPLFTHMRRGFVFAPARRRGREQRVSFLHVDDCARAIVGAAVEQIPLRTIYEIDDPSPSGYSWAEIADIGAAIRGRNVRCVENPRAVMTAYAHANSWLSRLLGYPTIVSPGKISEMFHTDWVSRHNLLSTAMDWTPLIHLEEGFAETYRWHMENRIR